MILRLCCPLHFCVQAGEGDLKLKPPSLLRPIQRRGPGLTTPLDLLWPKISRWRFCTPHPLHCVSIHKKNPHELQLLIYGVSCCPYIFAGPSWPLTHAGNSDPNVRAHLKNCGIVKYWKTWAATPCFCGLAILATLDAKKGKQRFLVVYLVVSVIFVSKIINNNDMLKCYSNPCPAVIRPSPV